MANRLLSRESVEPDDEAYVLGSVDFAEDAHDAPDAAPVGVTGGRYRKTRREPWGSRQAMRRPAAEPGPSSRPPSLKTPVRQELRLSSGR